jgi:hypothetical protein
VHRLLDRQTWELGGSLDDVTLVLRNWLTPPVVRMQRGTLYSTAGPGRVHGLYPGNLWARWTLLPGYDLQHGGRGVLVGRFDRVSLIRTLVESAAGEDRVRHLDLHGFEQAQTFATNPKTILHCPDVLDDVDVLNLWTRLHDEERDRACAS